MPQALWQNLLGFVHAATGLADPNRTLDKVWPVRSEPSCNKHTNSSKARAVEAVDITMNSILIKIIMSNRATSKIASAGGLSAHSSLDGRYW